MSRARYRIIDDTPELLLIEDIGSDVMSVTNDAEAVVEELADRLGKRRLEYYDSQGARDQLLVVNGKFAGFAPAQGGL
jgi:uncharacterized protein (DUF2164 family)